HRGELFSAVEGDWNANTVVAYQSSCHPVTVMTPCGTFGRDEHPAVASAIIATERRRGSMTLCVHLLGYPEAVLATDTITLDAPPDATADYVVRQVATLAP